MITQQRRVQINITGAVQGVGFRPFVFRIATDLGLDGWVSNSPQGVKIEAEGDLPVLETLIERIPKEKPPHAIIKSIEFLFLKPVGYQGFEIRHSNSGGSKTALILPDIATCPACLAEMNDPNNRRYRYPFINCTHCGPRYSIITGLPYDRTNTTMHHFEMCEDCRAEYENPYDRRFHAQPNACPKCGPQLQLWDLQGGILAERDTALKLAAQAIRDGRIVALKGLGGFQLIADARNSSAVKILRQRKNRPEKPFAVMAPGVEYVREHCHLSPLEDYLLASPEAPILLVNNGSCEGLAPEVAPGMPSMGVMLPYTGTHHLLMAELGFPVIATSGNVSDEPICTDEYEALEKLGGIADLLLVHNRPIAHHVDDSIVQVMAGRGMILRRARGYAPLPIQIKQNAPTILATGAHLKNTIAASVGQDVFVSQHIGDLESASTFETFRHVIHDFEKLYDLRPTAVAYDLHPDYLSSQFALESHLPHIPVQHHYAHVLACMAENKLDEPVLGVAWDGTGYGLDGTIWGGEFLDVDSLGFTRAAHIRPFPLPGGESAVREPRRSALGLLYSLYGDAAFEMKHLPTIQAFTPEELRILQQMLHNSLNTPLNSSMGRFFDAIASLLNIRHFASFEGQAAIELEAMAQVSDHPRQRYPFSLEHNTDGLVFDWTLSINAILQDLNQHISTTVISARFHNTLAEMIIRMAHQAGRKAVVLTGGCFQNRFLTEKTINRLREEDFQPYWHQHIPSNDGGIALGQILAAVRVPERS